MTTDLKSITIDSTWNFNHLTRSQTNYVSHGYHKYPAKFIPQIVQKLLFKYSKKGDLILDPFGGCGTTLVEAKLHGRNSIAVDVNDIAVLISKAKIQDLDPGLLEKKNDLLIKKITHKRTLKNYYKHAHPRLKYWFTKNQFNQLKMIHNCIKQQKDVNLRIFYECCFSNILKNCSIWYSKSIKPMRDLEKKIQNPTDTFIKHLNYMTNKNNDLYSLKKYPLTKTKMMKGDARKLKMKSSLFDLIITSPPYATSYEYADLHQLSLLWFEHTKNINNLKKDFVGTTSSLIYKKETKSSYVNNLIKKITTKNKTLARHISNYYTDLEKCYSEMFRVLKPGKTSCIILGDTEFKGIKISNTQASIELLQQKGFQIKKIIKRKLSSKIFTPFRNKEGKFTNSQQENKRKIYQYEYIIIAFKPHKQ